VRELVGGGLKVNASGSRTATLTFEGEQPQISGSS